MKLVFPEMESYTIYTLLKTYVALNHDIFVEFFTC